MAKTYSFLDTHCGIAGPGGVFSVTNGAAKEGFTFTMREDKNKLEIGADGSGIHSLRADNSGLITLRFLKNSPTNALLSVMYNLQKSSSALWGHNTIACVSSVGDVVTATDVAFKKQPAVTYSEEAQMLEWEFEAVSIIEILAASIA